MSKREVQTDKAKTKDCPCTYPGCDVVCVVNEFYAPSKARCAEHKKRSTPDMHAAAGKSKKGRVQSPTTHAGHSVDVSRVGIAEERERQQAQPKREREDRYVIDCDLRQLICPICGCPMKINSASPSHGSITLVCQDLQCDTAVEIVPGFGSLAMRKVPDELKPIVATFNDGQREKFRAWRVSR